MLLAFFLGIDAPAFVALAVAAEAADAPYRWQLPPGFPQPPIPADNRMTAAKVALGRRLFFDTALSVTALEMILIPGAILMMVGLLQPAKGAVIAVQWWFGLHGFVRERRP